MNVALIQLNAQDNKPLNIQKAIRFVEKAVSRRAEFILLPEMFNFRGSLSRPEDRARVAEFIPGESTLPFIQIAKKKRVSILTGSVREKISGSDKMYNTSVLIGPDGKIKARYRKINLFDARIGNKKICESERFKAGQSLSLVALKEFKVGLAVCYDVRFADIFDAYSRRGANVFCLPSAFTAKTGQALWEVLLRARAIENLSYVLAPNQIGRGQDGVLCYGHSLIVDPWGRIVAEGSATREEIVFGKIDLKVVKEARKILPSIKFSKK